MTGLEELAQILGSELQAIAGAPITFVTATLTIGCVLGLVLGFFVRELRGWSAWTKMDRLHKHIVAEDDLLEIIRAKHEHEVEIREEIEADFARLHNIVDRVHNGHTTADELISDATMATENAVEELKRAHEEFLQRMKTWDADRFHRQHEAPVSEFPSENTQRRIRSSGRGGG